VPSATRTPSAKTSSAADAISERVAESLAGSVSFAGNPTYAFGSTESVISAATSSRSVASGMMSVRLALR